MNLPTQVSEECQGSPFPHLNLSFACSLLSFALLLFLECHHQRCLCQNHLPVIFKMLHQAFFINNYLFARFPFLWWFFCVIFPVEDQPDVDHLGLRHWSQLLDLTCEDGRQHQHDGQVHREARP